MPKNDSLPRRKFLKQAAGAIGAASQMGAWPALGETATGLIAKVPAGRGGLAEEFAAACAFLCSTRASYITGQNLLVDGGLCAMAV